MIRDSGWNGPRRHRLPARSGRRSRVRGLRRQPRPVRRDHRLRHRHLGRLSRGAPRAPRLLQGVRRDLDRPRPSDRRDRRPVATPTPRRCSTACARGTADEREQAELFRGQMLTEMARMSLDDGLVLQIHPGSWRNHSPGCSPTLRPRQGRRHPDRAPTTCAALKPLLDRGRQRARPDDHPLHARRDDATRASSRRSPGVYPGAEARPGLVVPRQPRGHAPLPRADHRDRRLLQHRRLQRRHPRLPVDPGPPRRRAPRRLRVPRARWSPSTGSARTRRTRSRRTSPIRSRKRRTGSDGRIARMQTGGNHVAFFETGGSDARRRRTDGRTPRAPRRCCARPTPIPTAIRPSRRSNISASWSKERTGGRYAVEVYHSAQLGEEKDTIEQVRSGVIDLNRVSMAPFNGLVPETIDPVAALSSSARKTTCTR